jgi:hypothetical protein
LFKHAAGVAKIAKKCASITHAQLMKSGFGSHALTASKHSTIANAIMPIFTRGVDAEAFVNGTKNAWIAESSTM